MDHDGQESLHSAVGKSYVDRAVECLTDSACQAEALGGMEGVRESLLSAIGKIESHRVTIQSAIDCYVSNGDNK